MKKRAATHLIDAAGIKYLQQNLPNEWVVREYRPDYGIDFAVEVFDYADTDLVSLGEHFFIQLKSKSKIKIQKKRVYGRMNIEKTPLKEDSDDWSDIDVAPVQLDISDLQLARSMGPAMPILLVVCDISKNEAFFVCLNDYVDKLIIPQDPSFPSKKSIVVHVPTWTRISRDSLSTLSLRFYARRAKLYAAFNKFRYQNNELQYLLERMQILPMDELRSSDELRTLSLFLDLVKGCDFWTTTHAWPAIELTWRKVLQFEERLLRFLKGEDPNEIYKKQGIVSGLSEKSSDMFSEPMFFIDIHNTWAMLANLGNMFEEICREWDLPTHLASMAEQYAIRTESK